MDKWKFYGKTIKLKEGNIVLLDVEAVVNAANKNLQLGGGVAGAIRNFGGPSIQEECNKIGPVTVGEAVITTAGNLKSKYVIHAVGPIYGEGDEDEKLRRATLNSLYMAKAKEINSIAFPAISTGIYKFPLERCSKVMTQAAIDFLRNKDNEHPKEVIFCLYGQEAYSVFKKTVEQKLR